MIENSKYRINYPNYSVFFHIMSKVALWATLKSSYEIGYIDLFTMYMK